MVLGLSIVVGLPVLVVVVGFLLPETIEPTARLVRELSDSVAPMTARWTFTILPDDEGAMVSIAARTVVARGTWHVPFIRIAAHLLGSVRKGLEQYLRSVGGDDARFDWS